jgi:hypothetical protein
MCVNKQGCHSKHPTECTLSVELLTEWGACGTHSQVMSTKKFRILSAFEPTMTQLVT